MRRKDRIAKYGGKGGSGGERAVVSRAAARRFNTI
jgi:hypothetical protein